ncbi:MAG: hypothetical protein ACRDJN_01960 [Chloroflexota bacterium]
MAERLVQIAQALRVRTRTSGHEWAATLDASTGDPVGGPLHGAGKDIDLRSHFELLSPGHTYVTVHTHPMSSPPSPGDVLVLVANPSIDLVSVAGVDGTWYVVARSPEGPRISDRAVRLRFTAEFLRLRPGFDAQAMAGTLPPQEALTALLDTIWQRIAPSLGLHYDRVR